MSNLTRFNRIFGDTFFDDFFKPLATQSGDKMPAIDVHESDDAYVVNVDLPGINKDDIEVSLKNGMLTIKAEVKSEDKEEKDGKIIRQERHFGQYLRQLSVGSDIKSDAVQANYDNGVLRLELPKLPTPATEDKKIEIK